jgi:alkanesulfonate monooxygenase SsuD/methylene tetrahydromethanopterin reductase-like flavin-dependent oxidoreductase (luciferase family)
VNVNAGIFHQVWAVSEVSDRQCIAETLADARLADELGFASFAFGEHHFGREKAYFGRVPIPEYLIARLAAETSQIALGTAVKVLPFDTASRCAEGIALLDILTGGRIIFGIGMGVRTDPLAEKHDRGALFRDQLEELSGYLRSETGDGRPLLTPAPERDLCSVVWVAAREPESIDAAARLGLNFVVGQAEHGVQQRHFVDRFHAAGGTGQTKGARMVLVADSDAEAHIHAAEPAWRTFNQMKNGRYYQLAVEEGRIPASEPSTSPAYRMLPCSARCGSLPGMSRRYSRPESSRSAIWTSIQDC